MTLSRYDEGIFFSVLSVFIRGYHNYPRSIFSGKHRQKTVPTLENQKIGRIVNNSRH